MTKSDEQADTTKKQGENQEVSELERRLARRARDCHALMAEKEHLVLTYAFNTKIPKPYYERWKLEANDMFTALVSLSHRRRR